MSDDKELNDELVAALDRMDHVVTDVAEEILATYNLMLLGPTADPTNMRHWKLFKPALRETEENLTDLLPDGYRVVIREWSSDE